MSIIYMCPNLYSLHEISTICGIHFRCILRNHSSVFSIGWDLDKPGEKFVKAMAIIERKLLSNLNLIFGLFLDSCWSLSVYIFQARIIHLNLNCLSSLGTYAFSLKQHLLTCIDHVQILTPLVSIISVQSIDKDGIVEAKNAMRFDLVGRVAIQKVNLLCINAGEALEEVDKKAQ